MLAARFAKCLLIAVMAATIAGCAVAPSVSRDTPNVPARFSASGGAEIPRVWWRAYEDPGLDAVMARAFDDNPGLMEQRGRLSAARAAARAAGAATLPDVRVNARGDRSKPSSGAAKTTLSLGGAASFEIDLWGRLAAKRDAAVREAEASLADLEAARISLSGEVADAWYALAAARAERKLIDEQMAVNARTLNMVRVRVRNGLADRSDLLRQRDLIETGKSLRADAHARVERQHVRLTALLGGREVTGPSPDGVDFGTLPGLPATGVPGTVVERRPDVRRARLELRAADRRVDEAVAAQYPRLTLTADLSTSAPVASELFASWLAGLVGEIAGPVFDGGRRIAEVDRAGGELAAAVARYRAAVVSAIEEVEVALADYERAAKRMEVLDRRVELAGETAARVTARYRAGAITYLDVLDATRALQDVERAQVAARADALAAYGALVRALAGPLPDTTTAHIAMGKVDER